MYSKENVSVNVKIYKTHFSIPSTFPVHTRHLELHFSCC